MALAKATPASLDRESTQRQLTEAMAEGDSVADATIDAQLQKLQTATDT